MMIINLSEEALNKIKKEGESNKFNQILYIFLYINIYFNTI
jgi:hypothetical protein